MTLVDYIKLKVSKLVTQAPEIVNTVSFVEKYDKLQEQHIELQKEHIRYLEKYIKTIQDYKELKYHYDELLKEHLNITNSQSY